HAMDVFVLSSLREGLPNVVLEALATRVPVVATKVAGVPAIIQHEYNGLLVAPNQIDELAFAIERLAKDSNLRQRLADAGRRVVEEKYSFAVRMQKIRAVYDQVMERVPSATASVADGAV